MRRIKDQGGPKLRPRLVVAADSREGGRGVVPGGVTVSGRLLRKAMSGEFFVTRALSIRCALVASLALILAPLGVSGRTSMVNGLNYVATIGTAGEVDAYTFDATAGEVIMLAIGEVGPNSALVPWIRLQRPDGTQIAADSGALAAQIEIAAPSTGTYTVLVASADAWFDDTGTYTLTLAKAPGAFSISNGDEGGPMTNGATHTGTIHIGATWTCGASTPRSEMRSYSPLAKARARGSIPGFD